MLSTSDFLAVLYPLKRESGLSNAPARDFVVSIAAADEARARAAARQLAKDSNGLVSVIDVRPARDRDTPRDEE